MAKHTNTKVDLQWLTFSTLIKQFRIKENSKLYKALKSLMYGHDTKQRYSLYKFLNAPSSDIRMIRGVG